MQHGPEEEEDRRLNASDRDRRAQIARPRRVKEELADEAERMRPDHGQQVDREGQQKRQARTHVR